MDTGSATGLCCKSIPLLQTICTLAILAGTVIFCIKSGHAFGQIRSLMADLKVMAAFQTTTKTATTALLAAGMGVLIVILLLGFIATLVTTSGRARRYKMRHGARSECFLSSDWWRWIGGVCVQKQ